MSTFTEGRSPVALDERTRSHVLGLAVLSAREDRARRAMRREEILRRARSRQAIIAAVVDEPVMPEWRRRLVASQAKVRRA